ncbi:MAG: hypothetical protein H0T76_10705 [Nannocystis sp.]|nr:hypothetical protein [Nannocystis sp.]MBA3546942.1 hypothetical protein [Nannocystis sp.]
MGFAWNVAEALRFRDESSEAMLWRPRRSLLITRVTGHAGIELLDFYEMQAEREMPAGPLRVFHDWSGLTGYDPAVRDELKRWGKLHTREVAGVHYLVRSKVVAMLISVAALSMGRDLDATTDRTSFMRQVDAAITAR